MRARLDNDVPTPDAPAIVDATPEVPLLPANSALSEPNMSFDPVPGAPLAVDEVDPLDCPMKSLAMPLIRSALIAPRSRMAPTFSATASTSAGRWLATTSRSMS